MKMLILLLVVPVFLVMNSLISYAGNQQELYDNSLLIYLPSKNVSIDNSSHKLNGDVIGDSQFPSYITAWKQVSDASAGFSRFVTDYIEFTNTSHFNSMINFTVTLWVNNTGVSTQYWGLTGQRSNDAEGQWSMAIATENRLQCEYIGTVNVITSVPLDVQSGTWQMLTCRFTFDGALNISAFINNTFNGSARGVTSKPTLEHVLRVGNTQAGAGQQLENGINALVIHNSSLSNANISFMWTNGSAGLALLPEAAGGITNSSPSIAIGLPSNNSQIHNTTLLINFSVTTTSPNLNLTQLEIWLDKNSTFITRINRSENFTSGNFTFYYSVPEFLGSVNGTVFLKVNGTDNASNYFERLHIFNITNSLNFYNITNLTMTPSILLENNNAKCHFNITNKANILTSLPNQSDKINKSDLRWWVNGSIVQTANNNSILNAPNVTANSNITCQARFSNGFGETAWTEFMFALNQSIGDITKPAIAYANFSSLSITSGIQNNATVNATDNTFLSQINMTIRSPSGILFNRSCQNILQSLYSCSITLFDGDETSENGIWNMTIASAMDTSSNIIYSYPNVTFEVAAASSDGGSSPTGGGGGGGGTSTKIIVEEITILGNLSLMLKPPIVNTYFIYTPFRQKTQRFSIDLISNKILDKCASRVFECSISDNIVNVALNYSNDSAFIRKVEDKLILVDKAMLAKTIDAKVRFINFAYAFPMEFDVKSRNYAMFRLENIGVDKKGDIKGIRAWFVAAFMATVASGVYLYIKTR